MGVYPFLIRYSITCVQRARLSLDHLLIETKPMFGGIAFHPKARWETCSDLHVPQFRQTGQCQEDLEKNKTD